MPFKVGESPVKHKSKCSCFRCTGIAWNKGLKGIHLSPKTEFKPGDHPSPKTEIKKGQRKSPKTEFKRKNIDLTYQGLHSWIRRKYGNANLCENCGSEEKVNWANKTYQYLEDRKDWFQLCINCHMKYDRANGWGKAKAKFPAEFVGGDVL